MSCTHRSTAPHPPAGRRHKNQDTPLSVYLIALRIRFCAMRLTFTTSPCTGSPEGIWHFRKRRRSVARNCSESHSAARVPAASNATTSRRSRPASSRVSSIRSLNRVSSDSTLRRTRPTNSDSWDVSTSFPDDGIATRPSAVAAASWRQLCPSGHAPLRATAPCARYRARAIVRVHALNSLKQLAASARSSAAWLEALRPCSPRTVA